MHQPSMHSGFFASDCPGDAARQSFAPPVPPTLSGSSGSGSVRPGLSFEIDARGWNVVHVPIATHSYRILISGKIVHVPPQSQILTVAVNPARTMPDEWTLGGVTFFVISPGNTDESEEPPCYIFSVDA